MSPETFGLSRGVCVFVPYADVSNLTCETFISLQGGTGFLESKRGRFALCEFEGNQFFTRSSYTKTLIILLNFEMLRKECSTLS